MAISLQYQLTYARRKPRMLALRWQLVAAGLLFLVLSVRVYVKLACTDVGYDLARSHERFLVLDLERRELELQKSVILRPDELVRRSREKLGMTRLSPQQVVRLDLDRNF